MTLTSAETNPKHESATTFANNMSLPVHRWFRYSAGFSATWAERVIRDNQARNVLDPFAGSGTTVIAAESAGVSGIGVDIHPFVARVAQAKLAWRVDPDELLARGNSVLSAALQIGEVELPKSPLIARCFDPETLLELTRLQKAIESSKQGDAYDDLLWLALVSILRVCSPVGTAQWQYVLPGKSKARVASPYPAFKERLGIFAHDIRAMDPHRTSPEGLFLAEDARTLDSVPDGWADLILTSPPYANNFDYADATRLEMSFLGEVSGWGDLKPLRDRLLKSSSQQMGKWDAEAALESPLLAPIRGELVEVYRDLTVLRKERAGSKAYNAMIVGYFLDSASVWAALRAKTSRGGRVCYVVGDSAPYGVHVPVERWLAELAGAAGFGDWSFEKVRDRNVKWENRKHRHPLHEGYLWIEA